MSKRDRYATVGATLLAAWIAIHLASQLVRNRAYAKLISWAAWAIAALSILGLLEPTIAVLDAAAIPLGGDSQISLYDVIRSTIALAVLTSIALYLASLLEARIRTSQTLSPTVQVLFTKSLKIVLVVLAVLIAIRSVGIDLTALAVVGGAIGIGIGFGFQKTVSNLISGVILLIDKSIKPGDVIAVAGTYGWVTTLGGRYVSVVTRDGVAAVRADEMRESERQAELGGERAAVIGGAEQPDLRGGVDLGLQPHALEGMLVGQAAVEVLAQLPHLLREVARFGHHAAADRVRGARAAAWGAADAEVDAAGIERFQHAKGLGDPEGAVVGEQHAPRADADALRLRAQARQQHLGAGIGERADGVVLGEPVAVIAQLVHAPRQLQRLLHRAPRAEAADDRRLVEDG